MSVSPLICLIANGIKTVKLVKAKYSDILEKHIVLPKYN